MNPARFKAFAAAFTPAVLQAVVDLGPYLAGKTVQQYAEEAARAMLVMVETNDIEVIEHYSLNTKGGAFRLTCDALGIANDLRSIRSYLDGG